MLLPKFIEKNPQLVIDRLAVRNLDAKELVFAIIQKNQELKACKVRYDEGNQAMNLLSKEVAQAFKERNLDEGNRLKEEATALKESNKETEELYRRLESEAADLLLQLPNIPHEKVKSGNSEEDNELIVEHGEKPTLSDSKLPHWELIKHYDIIDFELGAKITGAGFPLYKGKGAKLQRALISFFLDQAVSNGYQEVLTPLVVNEDSGYATGQLPDKEGQMYHITEDNLYLIPTAEVPVTNIYRNTLLGENQFPIKHCAYSACFRREAGAWGSHVRGLNRLHQFDKVEIVQIVHPQDSYQVLEEMVSYVKGLLEQLELPFRIVRLCGGDLGFTSAMTYDFEVWSAAQERWLEVSSVSNFESFQAHRMKCRYKDVERQENQFAHTLNGSALALPRIMAAILENNQESDKITIPAVLRPYTQFNSIS